MPLIGLPTIPCLFWLLKPQENSRAENKEAFSGLMNSFVYCTPNITSYLLESVTVPKLVICLRPQEKEKWIVTNLQFFWDETGF
jgi:hypothetical protein